MRWGNVARLFCASALFCGTAAAVVSAEPGYRGHSAGPARSVQSFVEAVAVNVHLSYRDTPYGNFPAVERLLEELGVHHVRDGVTMGQTNICEEDRALASHGIRVTYMTQPTLTDRDLASWASCVRPAIEAYEGPNEYDISHPASDGDWVATLQDFEKRLYVSVKHDPALAALPVIGPSLTSAAAYRSVGDLSAYMDRGNMHNYFKGLNPGTSGWGLGGYGSIDYNMRIARLVDGGKPISATETGYETSSASNQGLDAQTQAKYVPRMFLEQFNAGVSRTYEYELIDEGGPPFDSYGLVRGDLTPKPAFHALASLLGVLRGSGTSSRLAQLAVSLDAKDDVHQTLLEQDGRYYLALWIEAQGYDPKTHTPVAVPSERATVRLGCTLRSAVLYRYDSAFDFRATRVASGPEISVPVTDTVEVLELTP